MKPLALAVLLAAAPASADQPQFADQTFAEAQAKLGELANSAKNWAKGRIWQAGLQKPQNPADEALFWYQLLQREAGGFHHLWWDPETSRSIFEKQAAAARAAGMPLAFRYTTAELDRLKALAYARGACRSARIFHETRGQDEVWTIVQLDNIDEYRAKAGAAMSEVRCSHSFPPPETRGAALKEAGQAGTCSYYRSVMLGSIYYNYQSAKERYLKRHGPLDFECRHGRTRFPLDERLVMAADVIHREKDAAGLLSSESMKDYVLALHGAAPGPAEEARRWIEFNVDRVSRDRSASLERYERAYGRLTDSVRAAAAALQSQLAR